MIATRILRRPRVLIVGCGDVGLRTLPLFHARAAGPRVIALTHHPERAAELRAAGALPITGDLDARRSLARLAGIARHVLHLAPPQRDGDTDRRTRALLAALRAPRRSVARGVQTSMAVRPAWRSASFIVPDTSFGATSAQARLRFVYASTTGVYGDCRGARIDETRPVRPENERARRRVSAEQLLRGTGVRSGWRVSIVRIPGIYAEDRLPRARIERAMPALIERDDVYTNHIHADDLAAIIVRTLGRGKPQRAINASDDTDLCMADYFDRVADACGLPRVPRITREEAEARLEPVTLSFMRESRRLRNDRLKRELGYALRYPTVDHFLRERSRGHAGPGMEADTPR
ncbi:MULTISPECIES: NAD-dependent epimerase/dehydratase family protein [unclassified Caballeronia]|uniref:NAD-dependent epimerase/dehydratase family protein n=1 Tax=unclassified Caballeronia TaxID=2646786 RepID=UPI0028657B35|nr:MULTISPECIES: NAD-dependent epimerase/dehydratase family protein [unclassified Caballeronia]MDR5736463.1 NAD-dependent epimerase/dehydratase family protein [Caballeronia sp. LZ016]MDR5811059.1 NAD-dependent epimerase/dehydratase family protein [Caballeronia sp. LZ019]